MLRSAATAFLFLLTAVPSHAFMAKNDLVVVPLGADSFEVPYRGLSGASDFWCAAGDYVVRDLHLPPTTRIYRTSSPPRRAGQGIAFSLSGRDAKKSGLVFHSGGSGLTAAHARQLCDVREFIAD